MKFLLYSDLHAREERLADVEKVLDKIGGVAKKFRVDWVISAGDVFHDRGIIKTSVFDVVYRKRKQWFTDGIKHIDVVGNHDQADKGGEIHPLNVFKEFKDWEVFDKSGFKDFADGHRIFFVPYSPNNFDIAHEANCDLVIHDAILGGNMGFGCFCDSGVDPKLLKGFKNVFAGHFHLRQKIEPNIQFIGSPFQQNFGEAGQAKGVLYYDSKTQDKQFVELEGMGKHVDVAISWSDGERVVSQPENISPSDKVRVKVVGTSEQVNSIHKNDLEYMFESGSIKVEREVCDTAFSRLNIDSKDLEDLTTLVKKYVEFVNPDLDKNRLMKIWDELIGSC